MKRTALALFALATLTALGITPRSQPSQDATRGHVLITLTGTTSAIETPKYLLAASQEVLQTHWSEHLGTPAEHPHEAWDQTPRLDFDLCQAILIFTGDRANSTGVRVLAVIEEPDAITIRFEHKSYQSISIGPRQQGDSQVPENSTRPWAMLVIPSTDKTIYLQQNVQGRIGGEPIWKQRAVFPGLIGVGRPVPGTRQR